MTEPKMPPEVEAEWKLEESRHIGAFVRTCARWPNFRLSFAYALLGSAVAMVDSMGGDADGFLRNLRAQEPKPAPMLPPRAS